MGILKALMHREVKTTGRKCELCHCEESEQWKLWEYFIDYDPTNHSPKNVIIFCPPCYRIFTTANPDGIKTKNGIFAFAINRGLYDFKKETS